MAGRSWTSPKRRFREQQTQKGKRGDNEGVTSIMMQGFSTVAGGDVSTAAGEEECRTGERNGHH
jgi:hypothetical protein